MGRYIPRNDLTGHFAARVCEVSSETEIGNFELTVRSNQQIVGLQILTYATTKDHLSIINQQYKREDLHDGG